MPALDADSGVDSAFPDDPAPAAGQAVAPSGDAAGPRPGRHLPTAVLVGLGMLIVVLASLLVYKQAFIVVGAAVGGVALWELAEAMRRGGTQLPLVPLWVGSLGICLSAYQSGLEGLMIAVMLTIAAAVVWRVVDGGGVAAVRDAAAATFAVAYVPLMIGFVMLVLASEDGHWKVLLLILLAVANDVGGFFVGRRLGKHRIAPVVSPKKSWEGMAGSVILTVAVGSVGAHLLGIDPVSGLLLGVVAPVTATLGDLSESLLKRDLGLKDMSSLLPGHGGVLDRIDSMLLTAPFVYVVLAVSSPVAS